MDQHQRVMHWADRFRAASLEASRDMSEDDLLKQLIVDSTKSMAEELEQQAKDGEKL